MLSHRGKTLVKTIIVQNARKCNIFSSQYFPIYGLNTEA